MSNALAVDPVRRPTVALDLSPVAPAPDASPRSAFRLRRGRAVAAASLVAGLGCVLAAQLLISIETAGDAFQLQQLQDEQTRVGRQVQVSTERLEVLSAPQQIAARAAALGMVPSGASSVLELGSGTVRHATGAAPLPSGTVTVAVPDALLGR